MLKTTSREPSGFTVIELVIVLAILWLVWVIALTNPGVDGAALPARVCQQTMRRLSDAVSQHPAIRGFEIEVSLEAWPSWFASGTWNRSHRTSSWSAGASRTSACLARTRWRARTTGSSASTSPAPPRPRS